MVSIITPVYNCRDFIAACIENVAAQAGDGVEHIIVDGGSTDGTVEIIEKEARRHPHLRWVSEPDRGQSDAMNKGVRMARGEVLGFLNADDYYQPGVLQRIAELFATLPEPSLAVGNCSVWKDDGSLWFVSTPSRIGLEALLEERYLEAFPMNAAGYFYHKSLHDLIGLYKVDEHYAMDLDFIIRAVRSAKCFYFDEIWGNYRYLPGTKTYQDDVTGNNGRRVAAVVASYRSELPLRQRAVIGLKVRSRRMMNRLMWSLTCLSGGRRPR